jgi:iron(III) transport system ATP-binding protein
MSELHIQQIDKRFNGQDNNVLDSLDLHIPSGKTVALLGRSGSGKTTLLRIIAGFIDPDSGRIAMDNRVFYEQGKSVVPEKRNIGFVFQDLALFPHMDALGNIGYGLPRSERKETAKRLLALVGMAGFGNRYPHELSGGQQQRIAIARALAPKPKILLMDEPFNSLDASIKSDTLAFVRNILDQSDITTIIVSHDFHEAEVIADSCAILDAGKVIQYDRVQAVKQQPANDFVRRIIASDYRVSGGAAALGL